MDVVALCVISMGLGVTASAQATDANGPYYATPSWDQKLAAATRFVVLLNWNSDAVLDRETGLVWEQSPFNTIRSWDSARFQCISRKTGGRRGWRLPTVHELASLLDPNNPDGNPDLPPGHPFGPVQASKYWSATTSAADANFAWVVDFYSGFATTSNKADILFVWCVRGGMNADVY
jgi:hypothetical protein